jgi:hypothetical protein
MILVMIGALNVILLAMQQQDKVTQAVVEKSNSSLGKLNEEITISEIKVTSSNKLNMTISNSGGAAAKLASIYVVNETAKQQYRYDLNNMPVDGRASQSNVGTALPLNVKSNTKYSVKVVTASGNTATSGISPVSLVALPMSLYVIPPTVSPGNNVSLLFTVSNNITDSTLGWPVTPILTNPSCSGCTLTLKASPSASIIPKGSTALFKWTYLVTSSDQVPHQLTFNASITGAKTGNFVIEKALAKLVDSSQISYTSEIVVSNDILQKPEIFLIIPSPFGDSGDKGLWGVVVINPTNQQMDVNRVVISMYSSQAAANQQFIEQGAGCVLNQVNPTSNWSCPLDNMLEWKNVASPILIPGYGIRSFLIEAQPGKLTSGPASAFMISVGVFTSLGQFTKTGLSSSMSDSALSLGNVYLTDTTTTTLADDDVHIFGHQLSLVHDATYTFRIAATDFDTAVGTTIKNGTKLIIVVPRGFTNVVLDAAGTTGFYTSGAEPKIYPYSDGSTQIIATMNGALGDTSREAKIFSFTAKAPIVNGTKVYIMHVFADGETSTNWSIGPIAQIGLQVYKP